MSGTPTAAASRSAPQWRPDCWRGTAEREMIFLSSVWTRPGFENVFSVIVLIIHHWFPPRILKFAVILTDLSRNTIPKRFLGIKNNSSSTTILAVISSRVLCKKMLKMVSKICWFKQLSRFDSRPFEKRIVWVTPIQMPAFRNKSLVCVKEFHMSRRQDHFDSTYF